ncbi:lantibiotic protection ABC transporter ATP-binding subunit [Tuanshanicoccus lijuaniae]|uniref:lantibiotic protection ABC transporter ATP-binding subunit n=1 Tax=Aerococcaceae bacterium zg-1292 TaxID=2774330 RepID=UPI001BD82C9F|nr:lantibiotic protection ABC transporter ATP-binding subunit [Aerococcaceae bacterium zg-A91]MBS4457754.1 lantibiotic protection ABC transporter ATP-binding subunit [Aerococcaceae bacterium zg-BR33]
MDMMLETRNLTKKVKEQMILENVSIKVEKGKIYGLLGPNGAGKSTLLKLITKVMHCTSGDILFEGKSMCAEDLKNVGAIIEQPAIYPNLTANENLEVLTTLLSIDKRRIDDVLKIVGLENTGKKLAKNFSLGMKQRLGIAMTLINSPKLLILDEPTNGLDPMGIQELRELIKDFSEKGITVIISSHILSEIQQVADKIGIINNGHLIYEGNNSKEIDLEKLFLEMIKKDAK